MEDPYLSAFLATISQAQLPKEKVEGDVIVVNETVSAAASVYESVRNALEYDEEHLLRRNAIRRILKRRFGEEDTKALAADLLNELIWARYLPNSSVPIKMLDEATKILAKFELLFDRAENFDQEKQRYNLWLLDVLSTELEYKFSPPAVDESLASLVYQNLKKRLEWDTIAVKPEDRELQLYIAVHRALLKSNQATLRYRVFSLYFPEWLKDPSPEFVKQVVEKLPQVVETVESQLRHPLGERLYRFVRRRSAAFLILRDIGEKNSATFSSLVASGESFHQAVTEAATKRYRNFYLKVKRSIVRAIIFILLTKSILALAIELPYDRLIVHEASWTPLLTNILFHPALLGVIGLSVSIPEKKNTELLFSELQSVLGLTPSKPIKFSQKRLAKGGLRTLFDLLYVLMFLVFVGVVAGILNSRGFNAVSIFFFLFFLSLVTFFGFKIRGSRRDLVMMEGAGGIIGAAFDVFFLPIVRAGRWLSMRAPRVNILLFFFDFIIEAPFKAAIKLIEGWLAFLREKKDEI
ncbi:MAG: hypothetical protein V1664_02420 [Candidatus Uhrbacteria bacterium]